MSHRVLANVLISIATCSVFFVVHCGDAGDEPAGVSVVAGPPAPLSGGRVPPARDRADGRVAPVVSAAGTVSTTIAVPYAAVGVGLGGRDPVLRAAAARTMGMTGRINDWDWEGGIAMVGLMHAYEVTGDEAILQFVADWVDARMAEGDPITDPRWRDPDCSSADWPGPWLRHPNHAAPA